MSMISVKTKVVLCCILGLFLGACSEADVSPFSGGPGTATITWLAPTTKVDGSSLNAGEISSYNVYYGESTQNLILAASLNSGSYEHTISDLAPGTYYFAVTVSDTNQNESSFSNIVSKVVE